MKKHDFESRKEALLKDIQDVMNDVEELYTKGVEAGSEEGKKAKAKLQEKLEAAKERLYRFEDEAGERIRHMPTARAKNTTNLKNWQKSVSKKAKNALPSLEKKRATASNAVRAKPMQPYTTNLITQWALPHWQAWSSASC